MARNALLTVCLAALLAGCDGCTGTDEPDAGWWCAGPPISECDNGCRQNTCDAVIFTIDGGRINPRYRTASYSPTKWHYPGEDGGCPAKPYRVLFLDAEPSGPRSCGGPIALQIVLPLDDVAAGRPIPLREACIYYRQEVAVDYWHNGGLAWVSKPPDWDKAATEEFIRTGGAYDGGVSWRFHPCWDCSGFVLPSGDIYSSHSLHLDFDGEIPLFEMWQLPDGTAPACRAKFFDGGQHDASAEDCPCGDGGIYTEPGGNGDFHAAQRSCWFGPHRARIQGSTPVNHCPFEE